MIEKKTKARMMIIMCVSEEADCSRSRRIWLVSFDGIFLIPFIANQKSDFALCGMGDIEEDGSVLPQAGQSSASWIQAFKTQFLDPTPWDSDSVAEICTMSISNKCPGDGDIAGPWNGLEATRA